jgi:hypothetical protein
MRMAHLDGWVDCATATLSPISAYADERKADLEPLGPDQFWAIVFSPGGKAPVNCVRIYGLHRGYGWGRFSMATLVRCTRPFPVLSTSTITFGARSVESLDYPDLGWVAPTTDGSPDGVRSDGGPSTLTFKLDPAFAGHDVRLAIRTSATPHVRVSIGHDPVVTELTTVEPGLEILVPRAIVDRATKEAMTVEFRSDSRGPLELKIMQMTAARVGQ